MRDIIEVADFTEVMEIFWNWVGKILWRRKWQPTPVLLPGKSHGRRSMVGYSGVAKSRTWLRDFTFLSLCSYHQPLKLRISAVDEDVFLEFPCFFYDPTGVGNLISGSSAFLKPAWTSGSPQFMYCWSLAWKILSITLLVCEMSTIVW